MILDKNKIIIDGVDVTKDYESVSIVINGDVSTAEVSVCKELVITGNVRTVKAGQGNITCGSVSGGVDASQGSVRAGDVGGDIKATQGRIACKNVTGNVTNNMGNIEIEGSVGGSVKNNMGKITINGK